MAKITLSSWVTRGIFILFSLVLVLDGALTLREGRLHYGNYWGGAVFAPLAIAAGLFLLAVVLLRWHKLMGRSPKLEGKAARLARQAEQTKFPIEDYEKW